MKFLSGLKYNVLILFGLILLWAFFVFHFPMAESTLYRSNYAVLLVGFTFCSILLATKLLEKNLFIFDPFLFSSVLLFCIFLIQPMLDIIYNEVYYYSFVNPAYGCQKGTFVFIASYFAFYVGSLLVNKKITTSALHRPLQRIEGITIAHISLILWLFFTVLCVIFLAANGYSIRYIFSLGQLGNAQVDEIFARFGFLWKFSTSMIASYVYYFVFGKSRVLKLIMFLATFAILLLNGGRAVLFIFLAAPIVYHYAKRAKNPPIQYIVIALSLFLVFSAGVQAVRWSLRSGGEVRVETQWNLNTIIFPMRSNFRVYKLYYLMVDAMPKHIDYLYGREMFLYTTIMFVPRTIWPQKPDAPFRDIIRYTAGELATLNGEAFPGLAEPYMDFGLMGCVVFCLLFGWFVSKLKKLYLCPQGDSHALVLYSLFYPFLFQIIIRGYIPSLLYSIVCMLLPYLIIRFMVPLLRQRGANEIQVSTR